MARAKPCIIVIKLGTTSIVHEKTHQPLLSTLSALVETVVHLRAEGHKVVLVSSGAIGVGLKRMEMASKPKSLSGKQALAAIGQGRLIALWDNLFSQLGQPIAQVLLTRGDISDRTRYLNAANTFKELLSMGVVPIVNENDTVSVSEIKFGDNDTLSAITSSMIHADYLFLLTDVDGLYTSNPRKDPDAKQIEVVTSITTIRSQVSTKTLGSSLGTGGMETKLIAAEIAIAAGVTTIITSSKRPQVIGDIVEYYHCHPSTSVPLASSARHHSHTPIHSGTTTPLAPNDVDPISEHLADPAPTPTPLADLPRPRHTMFKPSQTPLRDLKSWTTHTLNPSGSVVIDAGAHAVLARRDSGGRLLAAGVLAVEGVFASGQAVRILVRRTKAKAIVVAATIVDESVVPDTPVIVASASITSSISTITPLPQRLTFEDAPAAEPSLFTITESGELKDADDVDTETIEVGRGLANYNWEQIDKVKGRNSSQLTQLLGYADSEYVVENISIRVLP